MSPGLEQPRLSSPRTLARAIALLFLLTIVLGIIAQVFISERLISFRDPARTAGKPTLGYAAFSVVALIALAGAIVTIGWFLVEDVDEERWRALAATEAGR